MRRACFLPAMLLCAPLMAADAPSVQVETVTLKQQQMAQTLSGYGMVSPDTAALQSISLPRAGQIASLLVSPGQVVKKGAPLLEFATGADAALAYRQARHAVEFASSEVARTEQLLKQQLATRSQLAAARKTLEDAQAALRAQENIGAGHALERVVAPFDGVVMSLQAGQGERLAAGAPALQMARAGAQRVVLGVEPEEVARVRPGMPVDVVPVFEPERKIPGRVAQVFGLINPQTQFVDVLVDVPRGGLMPGMRVRADIQLNLHSEWAVPRSAVLRDAAGAYVFQVRNGKARRVDVQTGAEQDGMIAVSGALDTGEPVVSVGNYELHDGMGVRGSKP